MRSVILLFTLFFAAVSNADIVLYTDRAISEEIADAFTKKTGVNVEVVFKKEGYDSLMVEYSVTADADVFYIKDMVLVADLVSKNVLIPMESPFVESVVDSAMRDPNGLWTAVTYRARTLVYDKSLEEEVASINSYADLAKPEWSGRLCLRRSRDGYSQALVAGLIAQYGAAETDAIVKGWVSNLAVPVYGDDNAIIAAITGSGPNGVECQLGIVNSYYLGLAIAKDASVEGLVGIKFLGQSEKGVHVNGMAAGIAKTTQNKAEAKQFIEYLLSEENQTFLVEKQKDFPANKNVPRAQVTKDWAPFVTNSTNWTEIFPHIDEGKKLMLDAGYL